MAKKESIKYLKSTELQMFANNSLIFPNYRSDLKYPKALSVKDHLTNFCTKVIKKRSKLLQSSSTVKLVLDKFEIFLFFHQMIQLRGFFDGHFVQPT